MDGAKALPDWHWWVLPLLLHNDSFLVIFNLWPLCAPLLGLELIDDADIQTVESMRMATRKQLACNMLLLQYVYMAIIWQYVSPLSPTYVVQQRTGGMIQTE